MWYYRQAALMQHFVGDPAAAGVGTREASTLLDKLKLDVGALELTQEYPLTLSKAGPERGAGLVNYGNLWSERGMSVNALISTACRPGAEPADLKSFGSLSLLQQVLAMVPQLSQRPGSRQVGATELELLSAPSRGC